LQGRSDDDAGDSEGREAAGTIEKAMGASALILIVPHDVAQIIDALGQSATGARDIEGGDGIRGGVGGREGHRQAAHGEQDDEEWVSHGKSSLGS
jgi:hypothetical protein